MIEVRIEGLGGLAKGLRREASGARARSAIERVLTNRALKVLEESNRNIEEDEHIHTGDLIQSGEVLTTKKSSRRVQVDVRYTSQHAAAIHEGRRAGAERPPKGSLREWMEDKGFEGSEFLLASVISDIGSPKRGPSKFLSRAFDAERSGALKELAVVYDQEIVRATAAALFAKTIGK